MEKRNNVRAVVYDKVNGKPVFLLLRARKNYWQSPQGGVNEGESEIESVIRETKEETGLNQLEVFENTRSEIEYDAEREGKPIYVINAGYAVRADSKERIRLSKEEGHKNYGWFTYEETLKLLERYPEQKILFNAVYSKLI